MNNFDPMETSFTQSANVDLTRPATNNAGPKMEHEKALSDLNEQQVAVEKSARRPVIQSAEPVNIPMSQNVQAFDPTTLIPKKEKVDEGAVNLFADLDAAIAREKQSITERHQALEEAMYEDYISQEAGDTTPSIVKHEPGNTAVESDDTDSDDYNEDTSDDVYEDEQPAPEKKLRYMVNGDNFPTTEVTHEDKIELPKAEKIEMKITIKKTADEETYDEEEEQEEQEDEDPEARRAALQKKQQKEMDDLIEGLKTASKEKIKPNVKFVDLSQFSIAKQGVKASTVVLRSPVEANKADWVLYSSGYPITTSGLTGPELIKLDPENSNRNRANTIKDIYRIIYDHVVDDKKPSFMSWLKQTKYSDLNHIYFCLFMSTFAGSNSISYQCDQCKKVFIDDVPFEDMVVYKNDKAKERVKEILQKDTNVGTIEYEVDLVQASDTYVFAMRSPSLYNIAIENAGLPDSMLEKHSDLINTIAYIDSVYTIDYTNMTLVPIIFPSVKNDEVKSNIKKVKALIDILNKLSSDEYFILRGYISKVADISDEVSYKIPAAKCHNPDCDHTIPEDTNTDAIGLLFTRHRLGAFANM